MPPAIQKIFDVRHYSHLTENSFEFDANSQNINTSQRKNSFEVSNSINESSLTLDAFINISLQNNNQNKSRKKLKNNSKQQQQQQQQQKHTSSSPTPPTPPKISTPPWKSKELLTSQTLSLEQIQKEEEKVKEESFIKSLQGNTIPWLVDRNVAKNYSMEQIMKSQIEEQMKERDEKELMEALAAIEKMEKLENQKNNKIKKSNYRRKRGETR